MPYAMNLGYIYQSYDQDYVGIVFWPAVVICVMKQQCSKQTIKILIQKSLLSINTWTPEDSTVT